MNRRMNLRLNLRLNPRLKIDAGWLEPNDLLGGMNMIVIAGVYLGLCFLIALIGSRRKFGFWGNLFCSLFLTPVIGAIIMLASDRQPEKIEKCPNCDFQLEKRT